MAPSLAGTADGLPPGKGTRRRGGLRSENGPKESLVTEKTGPHPKLPALSDGNTGHVFKGRALASGAWGFMVAAWPLKRNAAHAGWKHR